MTRRDRHPRLNHEVPPRWTGPIFMYLTVCTANRSRELACIPAQRAFRSAVEAADGWTVGRYVLMPDHLHLVCTPNDRFGLAHWVGYWKRLMSRALGRSLWQREFFDHRIRSAKELVKTNEYLWDNPVRAKLVAHASEWPFAGQFHTLEW